MTATADTLAAHPHLLDGALGRALAYMALALLTGQRLWLDLAGLHAFPRIRPLQIAAVAIGLTGVLLVLNGIFLQEADPFGNEDTAAMDFDLAIHLLYQILWHTQFGRIWLLYGILLVAAACCIHNKWLGWLACLGMMTALAAVSHAGENGWQGWPFLSWIFLADLLHLAFALLWLGGMLLLAAARLGGLWQADVHVLQRFSRVALPIFLFALILGVWRLLVQYQEEQGLGTFYLLVLILKLAALAAVMASAWQLRRQLAAIEANGNSCLEAGLDKSKIRLGDKADKDQPLNESFNQRLFDDRLSLELFFAGVLVLFAALLTQLPPR